MQLSAEEKMVNVAQECRHRHNSGVSETRPCCEGDQAAICRRVTHCYQQENAERDTEAKHHIKRWTHERANPAISGFPKPCLHGGQKGCLLRLHFMRPFAPCLAKGVC